MTPPASGEGIYGAMVSGQHAAGLVLGIMQRCWLRTDKRRERFVSICRDMAWHHRTGRGLAPRALLPTCWPACA